MARNVGLVPAHGVSHPSPPVLLDGVRYMFLFHFSPKVLVVH